MEENSRDLSGLSIRQVDKLSPRELEVLECRCIDGLGIEGVAFKLRLSPETVKNHVSKIIAKLDCNNFNQICYKMGVRNGREH